MIGKMIAKTASSEEAAILKSESGDSEGDEAAVFRSLLDSLQGGTASEDQEKNMAAGIFSDEEITSLANEKNTEKISAKANDIFKILSEGNLKDENVKTQLRQLLNQLKQGGQEQAAPLEKADSAESTGTEAGSGQGAKTQLGKVVAELRGILDRRLSGEEAGSLDKAVASGQISEVTGKITQLLSEGDLKDEDVKTQLRQLLNQLKQGGQEQAAPLAKAGSAEIATTEAGGGQGEADPSGEAEGGAGGNARPEGKKIKDPGQEIPGRTIENKTELFSRSSNDDKEMTTRDNNRKALSDKESKDRQSRSRSGKSITGKSGTDTEKAGDAGRNGSVEVTDKQKRIMDNFFMKGASEGVPEKGLEMKGAQLRKSMKKEGRNPREGGTGRSDGVEGGRGAFLGGSSLSANANGHKSVSAAASGTGGNLDSINSSAGEQEIMWKEYSTESPEMKEEKESGQQMAASSSLKLSQIPIANGALRKSILPALTQNVLKAASQARKTPEQWQKHHFVLDDGKKMQLSVRETQGVLQVKMGSMNIDLSKLLQQHLQQIREHLKQEFGSEIDLQLDHPEEEGPAAHFSEDSPNRNGRDGSPLRSGAVEAGSEDTGKVNLKAIRNFGYNEMEWIA